MFKTNGSHNMLLLKIQIGVVSKSPIYLLNLYNAPINSYYLRRVAKLPIKSQFLMSNQVFIGGDLNLHYID